MKHTGTRYAVSWLQLVFPAAADLMRARTYFPCRREKNELASESVNCGQAGYSLLPGFVAVGVAVAFDFVGEYIVYDYFFLIT